MPATASQSRRALLIAVLTLASVAVGLALLSAGLFMRMGPAIEHIRAQHEGRVEASSLLLITLTAHLGEPLSIGDLRTIDAQIAAIKGDAPAADQALIGALTDAVSLVANGERRALADVAGLTQTLIERDLAGMARAEREAVRLGTAGAWLSVLVGLGVTIVALLVFVRLERRILRPIHELTRVLGAATQGDTFPRCRPREAGGELEGLLGAVNALLDRLPDHDASDVALPGLHAPPPPPERESIGCVHDRYVLLALLSREDRPALIWEAQDEIVATNDAALALLQSDDGALIRQQIADAAAVGLEHAHSAFDGIDTTPLGHGLVLCLLAASGADDPVIVASEHEDDLSDDPIT